MNQTDKKQGKLKIMGEVNLLLLAHNSHVKEEIEKEKVWNMNLEIQKDLEGKEKENYWVVEKEEFSQKNLFQNQILKSAIAGEKNNLLILSISKDDQVSRGIIRKLQAINITKTITPNREAQDDYEIWLLEKDKVPSSLLSE